MKSARRFGVIGLLGIIFLGSAGAKEKGEVTPPKTAGPQEVEVVGVVLDQQTQQPMLLLQGKRDKRNLNMAIGFFEAERIAIPLQGVTPPRPLTHDLFLTLFGRLKVSLRQVVITDLKDNIYYALVYLTAGDTEMTLDSRPSDAIALAIRAKAPILVEDRVFDKTTSTAPQTAPTPHF